MSWKLRNISDEQLANLVAECSSYRQISFKLGMSGGSGQKAIKRRIQNLQLDVSHFPGRGWSRGLTAEQHPSIASSASKTSIKLTGRKGRKLSLETRQKISRSATERSFRNGHIRTQWFSVFNHFTNSEVKVQGTWEKRYADWLNENGILWERPSKTFSWRSSIDDIEHQYHPDFYLIESSTYVEIKGFMWKDMKRKVDDQLKLKLVQEQNPDLQLCILMKNDLTQLGII